LHTLFNRGVLIVPSARTPEGILDEVRRFDVEGLPTTPTFLRMLLPADLFPDASLPSLRVITYGTERMAQPTLDRLTQLLPNTDFRQTFGMSELGIFRVKSREGESIGFQVVG